VRLVTPSSTDHLSCSSSPTRGCSISTLWIRGEIAGAQRDKGAAQVKRRLRNVALAGRNMYVALCRELRKRKPDELPAAEAATLMETEHPSEEPKEPESAPQAVGTEELEAA
jgi:hypothetical protein